MGQVERLEIPQAKIEDYLLNLEHPEGWSKAKFFLQRGLCRDHPEVLANTLARQATQYWPGNELPSVDSVRHRIIGPVCCPVGGTTEILTVWQVRDGSTTASFVTARPYRPKAS